MYDELLNEDFKKIIRYGKILVDINIPQVNTRILNIKDEYGVIWYCRLMDGNVYDLVDMKSLEKFPRTCNY